jgi:hypothetical protein
MVLFSPLPKLSSLLWRQPPNLNLRPSLSRQRDDQTLISMGCPQPKSPIQMDNSTAAGDTNKTIVPRWAKMMDMRFWWLYCRASQDQFCYYWDAGSKNWADYHTKHHPYTYHEAH